MSTEAKQFSLKEVFVAVAVLGVLFSILGSAIEDVLWHARIQGVLPENRNWLEMSVAERQQRIEDRKGRAESRQFRGTVVVAATATLAGLVIMQLLVRRVVLRKSRSKVAQQEDAVTDNALRDKMAASRPDDAMRGARFSLTEPLVIVCAALIVLSMTTSWFELRTAWRNGTPIPGLRQGHPYWDTEQGRQIVRRYKMSGAELIWIERTPESSRFRMACTVGAVYCLLLAGLTAHDGVRWWSRRRMMG